MAQIFRLFVKKLALSLLKESLSLPKRVTKKQVRKTPWKMKKNQIVTKTKIKSI